MDFFIDLLPALVTSPWLLVVVLAVCTIDGFFPPVPSETTLVAVLTASITVGVSPLWIATITAVAAVGAIAGDSIAYALGRRLGSGRLAHSRRPRLRKIAGWVTERVHSSPAVIILVGRYIPGGRVVVNMVAGSTGLRYRRFLVFSVIAGVSWAAMTTAIASASAAWLGHPLWSALLGIGIMLVLGLVIDHVARRRVPTSSDATAQEAIARRGEHAARPKLAPKTAPARRV